MPGVNVSDAAWVDVAAALSFANDKTYLVEVKGTPDRKVYAISGNGLSEPSSTEDALTIFPRSIYPAQEPRRFTMRAGRKWWMRTDHGSVRVVAEET